MERVTANQNQCDLDAEYEINRTVEFAAQVNAERIALQFPDEMLFAAVAISKRLSALTGKQVYIMADTTFGSCCVDVIAAQHASADLIVHYGPCCLSRPSVSSPVLFIFNKAHLDSNELVSYFTATFRPTDCVLMLYDVMYHHHRDSIRLMLEECGFNALIWPSIHSEYRSTDSNEKLGTSYSLQSSLQSLSDTSVFYIGAESLNLTNLILTHSQCKSVVAYDPVTKQGGIQTGSANKLLMRRYYAVQQAKDADVVGIVIGTSGLDRYLPVINKLKQLILANGKKPYLLSVGKPSPAKLGNFVEIDVFVLVACPENGLLESRDFLKPVITPYELSVALDGTNEWDVSKYQLDLAAVENRLDSCLTAVHESDAVKPDPTSDDESGEEPHFSLITGGYKQKKKHVDIILCNDLQGASNAISKRNMNSVSQYRPRHAAMEYFEEKRNFKGLEVKLGETQISCVEEGRSGIANGYSHEQ